jgi:hypothetical protein
VSLTSAAYVTGAPWCHSSLLHPTWISFGLKKLGTGCVQILFRTAVGLVCGPRLQSPKQQRSSVPSCTLADVPDGGSRQRRRIPDATCFKLNGWAMPDEEGQVGAARPDSRARGTLVSGKVRRGQNTMTSIVSLGLPSISCEVCLNEGTARPLAFGPTAAHPSPQQQQRVSRRAGPPPRDPPSTPAYRVHGKSAEFCVSLAKQPSGHNLSTQQVGPR